MTYEQAKEYLSTIENITEEQHHKMMEAIRVIIQNILRTQ